MSRRLLLLLLVLAWPGLARAWGEHYLITEGTLRSPSEQSLVGQRVKVESLQDFLKAEGPGLAKVISQDYDWLDAHGVPGRHKRQTYDPSTPTVDAFLRALRLNPKTQLPYVLRLMPANPPPKDTLPLADISTHIEVMPALRRDFVPAPPGTVLTVDQVLRTYSDEPDWGIDFDLWSHPEYGYGTEPYGEPTGESSKAAFHMKFAHEPWLVRKFVPGITDGMPVERMETFSRLARFALSTGHPYWGWRFAAWAIHYAQDLAQPYHSRALPNEGNAYYLEYIFSFHKQQMKDEATRLAKNRHFIYEDFVAYAMQQSYLEHNKLYSQLDAYLWTGPAVLPGAHDPSAIADQVMATAAAHAPVIDATIVKAFGPRLTEDPNYDVERAPDYHIPDVVEHVNPAAAHALLVETGKDFENAGEATRSMIEYIQPVATAALEPTAATEPDSMVAPGSTTPPASESATTPPP